MPKVPSVTFVEAEFNQFLMYFFVTVMSATMMYAVLAGAKPVLRSDALEVIHYVRSQWDNLRMSPNHMPLALLVMAVDVLYDQFLRFLSTIVAVASMIYVTVAGKEVYHDHAKHAARAMCYVKYHWNYFQERTRIILVEPFVTFVEVKFVL